MDLGGKIRKLREIMGMTATDVAEKAEVTPSLISQIERNIANPSLATLKKIADVLKTPLSFLFSEENNVSPVIRRNERRKITLGNNDSVIQELLSPDSNSQMEFLYITYEEGASSEGFVTHHGEECGLVLQGQLELALGTEVYTLEEGDSIYFKSDIPHSFKNTGSEPLKLVWVITPPSW